MTIIARLAQRDPAPLSLWERETGMASLIIKVGSSS
ncbi:hypothetical protein RHIZO_05277 [Rhizobiaceae bacterium]|nr:hypothetical protein RHIZO_05277 [Rhizobiaceae bacterium]